MSAPTMTMPGAVAGENVLHAAVARRSVAKAERLVDFATMRETEDPSTSAWHAYAQRVQDRQYRAA